MSPAGKQFLADFDHWREWRQRSMDGGLEADEIEEFKAAEENMIASRELLEEK